VPAALEALERDAAGRMLHLGYVVRCGPFALYHTGDTVRYDGMAARIRAAAGPGGIDVALLPINGRAPERRVPGNLTGEEAAALAHELGARLAVPMHFEMFASNTASPDGFAAACARLGQPHRVLRAGEGLPLTRAR
jgi:L-ascorbate metabolism protein UlaG (beta-lactamase superfamily)